MIPFTPHLAFESLELMNCKTVNIWPKIDKKNISNNVKLAVQINGKTRDIINIKKPKAFILENVQHLMNYDGGSAIKLILKLLHL